MIRVDVDGGGRTARAFREMGLKTRDLERAWARIGGAIRDDAVPLTPLLSGRLARTIRAGKTKSQATVRAGGYGVKYAGVQNYGHYNNITPKHFLNIALEQNADLAEDEVDAEVRRIAKRVGLR